MFWQALDPRRSNLGLVLGYVALGLGAGLLIVLGLLYWIFHNHRDLMVRDGLFGQAEEIAEELRIDAAGRFSLDMHEPMRWGYDAFFHNLKYRVLNEQGAVLLSSDGDWRPLLPTADWQGEPPAFFRLRQADGELAVGTYAFERDGRRFRVQAARSDRFSELAAEAMMPAVFETASVLALAAFVILLFATFLALRAALARIRRVSAAADAIQPDTLDARLSLQGVPLEIAPLVEAFNRALDRIAEGYRMQQRFVANAAHELKTPLTILRSRAELHCEGEARALLLADVDGLTRRVQQMLRLSQVQDIRNYRFAPVALRPLAEEVLQSFAALPLAASRTLVLEGESEASARADAAALFTALRNVVENALKCSPPGGRVTLRVLPQGYAVRDQGSGFDPAQRHLLFERFWRADASSDEGSGLGLSIVEEIARAHGGRVEAALNAEGGSCFTLVLGGCERPLRATTEAGESGDTAA